MLAESKAIMDEDRKVNVYTHVRPNQNNRPLISIEFMKIGTSGPNVPVPSTSDAEIPVLDSNFVVQRTGQGETVYMCPLPLDLKQEVTDENEEGVEEDSEESNDEDVSDLEDGNRRKDGDDANIALEDLNDDDPQPELTAYFNYFKGLYPDFEKLNPDRKEAFKATLVQLLKDQSREEAQY